MVWFWFFGVCFVLFCLHIYFSKKLGCRHDEVSCYGSICSQLQCRTKSNPMPKPAELREGCPRAHGDTSQQLLTFSDPPRSQATFSDGSGGWKHFPQLYPISSSNFTFFFFLHSVSQYKEEYEYVFFLWHLPKKARNKPNCFAVITCYGLRAVAVSSSGFENIVPVLKANSCISCCYFGRVLQRGYNLTKMGGDLRKH